MLFFLNDTATTEIYTYLHTLSLHDALPIWSLPKIAALKRLLRATERPTSTASSSLAAWVTSMRMSWLAPSASDCSCSARRSEEHTSELQSLMRISYAVFCLKKKKKH